jgi:hypothetical protein
MSIAGDARVCSHTGFRKASLRARGRRGGHHFATARAPPPARAPAPATTTQDDDDDEMSVQEYLEKHDLSKRVEEALNAAVKAKAEEPLAFVVRRDR